MKKITIIASIVAVIVGGYFGFQAIFGQKESTEQIVEVFRGEVVEVVSITGFTELAFLRKITLFTKNIVIIKRDIIDTSSQ